MKVVNVLPASGWTGLDNRVIRDWRLSVRARGLLMLLLSYPSGSDITIAKLAGWGADAREKGAPVEGREALQSAMRELERAGFVVHDKRHDKDTGRWATTTYVSAAPETIAQFKPSTALPRPADQTSGSQHSANRRSVRQSLSTYNTDYKTDHKTDDQQAGLQYSSSLASAREGEVAGKQDRGAAIEADLKVRYESVRQADETYLRDRLLKLERKRPAIFRKYRNAAIAQVENGEWPQQVAEVGASRVIDELSMMYTVRHYAYSPSGVIPEWLFRFPLRAVN